jgi:hypothetical protein
MAPALRAVNPARPRPATFAPEDFRLVTSARATQGEVADAVQNYLISAMD